jgi:amidase
MAVHHVSCTDHPSTLGRHTPIQVLRSGDTVITETVDAFGRDATGTLRSTGDNPLTGPFLVEGCEPGDTLAVHLRRITPSRAEGYSTSGLVPNVVDPAFVGRLPPSAPLEWHVNAAAGVVELRGDTPLRVPMRPMLGCLGVAPPHDQALWSGTAGRHGGNMDYRGVREGVTVYLPVFAPGALLYLGDGHAAQGAGEIGGHGVEISMEVEFAVDVRRGGGVAWPRGDDGRFVWTIGNARPLEQALQHATTEMLRWLQSDFGHGPASACAVLSQAVEYEVANVCDPAFSVVCKLGKEFATAGRPA